MAFLVADGGKQLPVQVKFVGGFLQQGLPLGQALFQSVGEQQGTAGGDFINVVVEPLADGRQGAVLFDSVQIFLGRLVQAFIPTAGKGPGQLLRCAQVKGCPCAREGMAVQFIGVGVDNGIVHFTAVHFFQQVDHFD